MEDELFLPDPVERGQLLRREETGRKLSLVCNSATMQGTCGGLPEAVVQEGGGIEEVEAATIEGGAAGD